MNAGAIDLLEVLWASTPDAWSTLHHRNADGGLATTVVPTDDATAWKAWLANHEGGDAWYRICPMADRPKKDKRGGAEATSAVPALYADIDWRSDKHPKSPPPEEVWATLKLLAVEINPSVVVHTGNGVQVCVLLDEPADPAVGLSLMARWNVLLASLGLHNDRRDLASIMRLPGTVNSAGGDTVTVTRFEPGCTYSVGDLDERLPEPDLEAEAPEGVPLADSAEVEAFLDAHRADEYPRALAAAVAGIDDTVKRQGGARHHALRLFLWQVLGEAMVGAYPARQAVDEGYARWQRHLRKGERRPCHELRDLLRWQVPRVQKRTDLGAVRARLDELFGDDPKADPVDEPEPVTLTSAHDTYRRWFGNDADLDAYDAVLATAAVDQMDGDPAWLLIIGGSGNAKTETVQSLATSPAVVITSTIASEGALLSAAPRAKSATGGLLKRLGDSGVLVIKDVTSILSMDRNVRGRVLAGLREVYDGFWERNVGNEGGRSLPWSGRIVVIGAVTTAWDHAHAVVAQMGDRFVLLRLDTTTSARAKIGKRSIANAGDERDMRAELAAASAGVLAGLDTTRAELSDDEVDALVAAADLVTRTRTAVETDFHGDPIDAHALEVPTRFAKELSQILRGAVAIGLDRPAALRLAMRCARDSMPPLRLDVLVDVNANPGTSAAEVSRRLHRPFKTVDRCLVSMQMLGLLDVAERFEATVDGGRFSPLRGWCIAPVVDLDVLARFARSPLAGL